MCNEHQQNPENIVKRLERRYGSKYPMVDGHLHIVDFLQRTRGLSRLLEYMDECNVTEATIF